MDNGERILYRDMLRRTERATARETEIEQEKRFKIKERSFSNHSTFFLSIYNTLSWVYKAHRAPDSTPSLSTNL